MAARGVNKVILVGNLGQDPEVRYMPNGNAVANITVATRTRRTSSSIGLHNSKIPLTKGNISPPKAIKSSNRHHLNSSRIRLTLMMVGMMIFHFEG